MGKKRVKSIGSQIDAIFNLRAKITELKKGLDAKSLTLNELKNDLIEDLQKQGIEGSTGNLASVTIKTNIHAQPKDWELFYEFLHEERAYHMMYKKVSDVAYREMLELRGGESIPGIESFEKTTLSIRRRT